MPSPWPRANFTLTKGAILYAVALVAAAAVILGSSWLLIGPITAQAGYLAMMFLLSPSRALPLRLRLLAAAWAVGVAIAGYLVGPFGLVAIVVGVIAVSFVQALFRISATASVNRAPVNFVAFASLGAATGPELWMVALGSVIGAAFVIGISLALPSKKKTESETVADAIPMTSFGERFQYGLILALGAVIILLGAEMVGFPYAEWALLSYCMILSVGQGSRLARARDRVLGTVLGAIAGTLLSFLPEPLPIVFSVLTAIICVAYLRMGNYTLFVTFLTPTILLTTTSDQPTLALGEGRIAAVLTSALLALALSAVSLQLTKLITRRRARATPITSLDA